ncbi:MAG: DUF1801 domain-containing protein [Tatlockia sp.]|nr:DUF1801 domain-containing protein [Tatlockia sp.]
MSSKQSSLVENFFDDLGFIDPQKQLIAVALRQEILKLAKSAEERIMYGGVLYYLEDSFCGIFSYKAHVSLEFGQGNMLKDPELHLEGSGKFRRHLKFKQLADVKAKQPAIYIKQAIVLLGQ